MSESKTSNENITHGGLSSATEFILRNLETKE